MDGVLTISGHRVDDACCVGVGVGVYGWVSNNE